MNRRKVGQDLCEPDGAFAPEWLGWDNRLPISHSLPLRSERSVGPAVIAAFGNLLPDSDAIRHRVALDVGADTGCRSAGRSGRSGTAQGKHGKSCADRA